MQTRFSALVFLCLFGGMAPAQAEQPVILFSQTYCPSCLAAKQYFHDEDIQYREFDIETSATAREYFEKFGGRGTPFFIVNGKRLQGFDEGQFRQLFESSGSASGGVTE